MLKTWQIGSFILQPYNSHCNYHLHFIRDSLKRSVLVWGLTVGGGQKRVQREVDWSQVGPAGCSGSTLSPFHCEQREHDSDLGTGMERHTEVFHRWTERVVQRKDSQICMGSGVRGHGGREGRRLKGRLIREKRDRLQVHCLPISWAAFLLFLFAQQLMV